MSDAVVNIGTVERLTGIPKATLRTWERRYGFPKPQRTEGGHRLYPYQQIEPLRVIAELLEQGHRASTVIGLELEELLARRDVQPLPARDEASEALESSVPATRISDAILIEQWLQHVLACDEVALEHEMLAEWSKLGTLAFLTRRVAPFLTAVGEAWLSGRIGVSHEHFASERVRIQLASLWQPLSNANDGEMLLLTTLPPESHDLGLHMVACLAAECGYSLMFLGINTPVDEIARLAQQVAARCVLLSLSAHSDPRLATSQLATLKAQLPPTIQLVVGGAGAPSQCDGVTIVRELEAFYRWLKAGLPLPFPTS